MIEYIDENKARFGVEPICEQLPIAPSTYYAAKTRPVSARRLRDDQLREEIRAAGFALETEQSLCAGIVWLFVGRAMTARARPTVGQRPGADTVLASERAA